jgi:hypothetical protein
MIYGSSTKNKHFSKVLLISVLCSVNYGLTAVLGYKIYGDDVQSQVTSAQGHGAAAADARKQLRVPFSSGNPR